MDFDMVYRFKIGQTQRKASGAKVYQKTWESRLFVYLK